MGRLGKAQLRRAGCVQTCKALTPAGKGIPPEAPKPLQGACLVQKEALA